MGKGSGIDSVNIWLEKVGIKATEEEALSILAEVKATGTKNKKLLTIEEFKKIATSNVSQKGN